MNDVVYYIASFIVFREPETWCWHQLQQRMQSRRAPLLAAALWARALSAGRWRARGKLAGDPVCNTAAQHAKPAYQALRGMCFN